MDRSKSEPCLSYGQDGAQPSIKMGGLIRFALCLITAAAAGLARPGLAEDQSASTQDEQKEKKAAARTMQVQVVGEDDKPLPGAKVQFSVSTNQGAVRNGDLVCDEAGQAAFELPEEIRLLRVWAAHKGHVPMFAQWWPSRESKPREIPAEYKYRLKKGSHIGGFIKNAEGKPVVGAEVEVRLNGLHGQAEAEALQAGPIPDMWLATKEAARKTDREGRWSLDNVPAADDTQVLVMVSHPDFASDEHWGGMQREQGVTMAALREGTATIVMDGGLVVGGTVIDPDGKAVAKALVVMGDDPYFQWRQQEVRTDESGNYRLPARRSGPLLLTIIAKGWAPVQRAITVSPATLSADFELRKGRTTRILFSDESGAPIPAVFVHIDRWHGSRALYNVVHPDKVNTNIPNKSDAKGVFEWTWSPGNEVSYIFSKEGYFDFHLAAGAGDHLVTLRKQ